MRPKRLDISHDLSERSELRGTLIRLNNINDASCEKMIDYMDYRYDNSKYEIN